MATTLFELAARLFVDDSEFDRGLSEAENKTSSFGSKLKSGLGTAAKVGAAAIGAVTTAAVGATKSLVSGVSATAEYGDNIDKMSQKMGLSAEAYQEWDAIMQHSGTSIESLQASMKTLANAVEKENEAFERLGMSQEEVAAMSNEDLFAATITALQNVGNETERTYLAGQLLGRGATELGALLNTSAEDTQAMKDRVHELGGVMSNESVKAAAKFQDSLQDMTTSFDGVKRGLTAEFLPSITSVMDGITALVTGDDSGLTLISDGVNDFVKNLNETAPKFLNIAVSLVKSFISAISENLPSIIDAGADVVMSLADGIVDNLPTVISAVSNAIPNIITKISTLLPKLVKAGLEIVKSLAKGIGEHIGEIVKTITQVIMEICEELTSPGTLVELVNAAIQIIQGLVDGLIGAIPIILESLPIIIENICTALMESLPLIIEAGITLFTSLVAALPDIIAAIVEVIPLILDSIISTIIDNLGMIIQAGIDLFVALIDALPQIIGTIAGAIPQIINGIVSAVMGNLDKIIMAGVELFVALIANLPTIIIEIVKAVPQIISGIVEGFAGAFGQMAEVGGNMLKGLWQGISDAGEWLWDKISGFFGGVVDRIKNFFGIHSPSRLFANLGDYMAQGLGEGFGNEMKSVSDDMVNAIPSDFDTSVKANVDYDVNAMDLINSISSNGFISTMKSLPIGSMSAINSIESKAEKTPIMVIVQIEGGIELGRKLIEIENNARLADNRAY